MSTKADRDLIKKKYNIKPFKLPKPNMTELRRGGKFAQLKLRWNTLEEAAADLVRRWRREMRSSYSAELFTIECQWIKVDTWSSPRRGDTGILHACSSCVIWDLRGKKPKPINGYLICAATPKPGSLFDPQTRKAFNARA